MLLVTNHELFMNHWYDFVKNLAALQKHTAEEEAAKPGIRAQYIEIISINFIDALEIVLNSVEKNDPYSQDFRRWLIAQQAVLTFNLIDLNIDKEKVLSLTERIKNATESASSKSFTTNEAQFVHVLGSIANKERNNQKVLEHAVGLFRTLLNELAEHYDWYIKYEGKITFWYDELGKIVGSSEAAEILQTDWKLFTARVDLEKRAIAQQEINIGAKLDQITEIRNRTLVQTIRAELAEALNRLGQLMSAAVAGAFQVGNIILTPILHPKQTLSNIGYAIFNPTATFKAIGKYASDHPLKFSFMILGCVLIPIFSVVACVAMPALIPATALAASVVDEIVMGVAIVGGVAGALAGTALVASSGNAARAVVTFEGRMKEDERKAKEKAELLQLVAERTNKSVKDLREQFEAIKKAERETRIQQIRRDQLAEVEKTKKENLQRLEQQLKQGEIKSEDLEKTIQELGTKIEEVDGELVELSEAIKTCEKICSAGEAEASKIHACQVEGKKFFDMLRSLPSFGTAASTGMFFSTPSVAPRQFIPVQIEGLRYQSIPGDGHCMYRAITYYLGHGEDIPFLRGIVAANLESNKEEYKGFIPLGDEALPAYIDRIRSAREWGGDLEINILMRLLNRPIVILGQNGRILNEATINLYPGRDPIFVYYDGIAHYDALIVQDGCNSRDILARLLTLNHPAASSSEGGYTVPFRPGHV